MTLNAVRSTAAVSTVHKLLSAVEWHQVIERETMIGRQLLALSWQLLVKLMMMLWLHNWELVQLFATSRSLEA